MNKPIVLYYQMLKYQPENLALLRELFDVIELTTPNDDNDAILCQIEGLFAPLGYYVDRAKMTRCQNLRVIVSNTTGIPHIDEAAAKDRGITICALHDEQEFLEIITPTAEHTIGLMIAAWRKIPAAHSAVVQGEWDRRPWGAPAMMSRLRLGIVGYGRLGQKVAKIAAAMNMKVRFYDPYQIGGYPDIISLAKDTDVLTIHAPALESTRNLVSREVLEALPSGSMVVNTARGELLDTQALLDLLEEGHLRAAALDVVDGEYNLNFKNSSSFSRLVEYANEHDNLLITPHIGGSTYDAWFETERFVINKASKILL